MADSKEFILWIAGIAVVLLVLQNFGLVGTQSATGTTTTNGVPTTNVNLGQCLDNSITLKGGPMSKRWAPTTSVSSINMRYFRNDGAGASQADSFTDTVKEGDDIDILYGFGANADTTYYTGRAHFSAPCGDFETKEANGLAGSKIALLPDSNSPNPEQLVAHGNITVTIKNQDTGLVNSGDGVNNETIDSGDETHFDITQFTTASQAMWSPWGPSVVVVEVNGTLYDESKIALGILSKYQKSISTSVFTLESTDSTYVAFEIPQCTDFKDPNDDKCDEKLGLLTIKAETAQNPLGGQGIAGTSDSVGNGDIKLTFINSNWDTHTVTGKPISGIQDDAGARSGFGTETRYLRVA